MACEKRDAAVSARPLFIPLKRAYFEAFESGTKATEYRPHGPRWNAQTCWQGRPAVLSLGYGKHRRLRGRITGYALHSSPQELPGWADCYGDQHRLAACIGIEVQR